MIEIEISLNLMKSLEMVGIEVSSAFSLLSAFSGCIFWLEDIAHGLSQTDKLDGTGCSNRFTCHTDFGWLAGGRRAWPVNLPANSPENQIQS